MYVYLCACLASSYAESMISLILLHIYIHTYIGNLWTQQELEEIVSYAEEDTSLQQNNEDEVLESVVVLLVTSSTNETSAVHGYLKSLEVKGNKFIYTYIQITPQATNLVYYIGEYGKCTTAVLCIPPGNGVSNLTTVASKCFPNLNAIISVGVACGIEKCNVKMFDVLVSEKIVNYDKTNSEHVNYLQIGEAITVSPQIIKSILDQFSNQWPNDEINKRLTDNDMSIPTMKSGIILSGPYDVESKEELVRTVVPASEAIGIEMEGSHLFSENQDTVAYVIIIKSVCDFGDDKKRSVFQPTAALLAADLVHKCLIDPQIVEKFTGTYVATYNKMIVQHCSNVRSVTHA